MYNIEMIKGDTLRRAVTFYDKNTGAVVDISGWTIFFTVKKEQYLNTPDDSTAVIKKTQTIELGAGASGIWNLIILPEETMYLEPGVYKYDIQYKKPDGTIKSIPAGDFILKQDVTKRTS